MKTIFFTFLFLNLSFIPTFAQSYKPMKYVGRDLNVLRNSLNSIDSSTKSKKQQFMEYLEHGLDLYDEGKYRQALVYFENCSQMNKEAKAAYISEFYSESDIQAYIKDCKDILAQTNNKSSSKTITTRVVSSENSTTSSTTSSTEVEFIIKEFNSCLEKALNYLKDGKKDMAKFYFDNCYTLNSKYFQEKGIYLVSLTQLKEWMDNCGR